MAVIKEFYMQRADGTTLNKFYSDKGFYILREDGEKFADAIEISKSEHRYAEIAELIEEK